MFEKAIGFIKANKIEIIRKGSVIIGGLIGLAVANLISRSQPEEEISEVDSDLPEPPFSSEL